ncbi:hypothetical protein BJX61DRAFT_541773 [Aspergillus egyptiacus]|nr:hypothetical protein BJX61DRAFT_541773 [Aspergillus egyptiacus]
MLYARRPFKHVPFQPRSLEPPQHEMPRVNYQGLALVGDLTQLTSLNPKDDARKAVEIVAALVHHITAAGCDTSTVVSGYYRPTNTWKIYVQLLEEAGTFPKLRWAESIRDQFHAHTTAEITPVSPLRDELETLLSPSHLSDLDEPLLRDWFDPSSGRWLFYSLFVVHRGIPLLPWANGVHHGTDSLAHMRLLRDDLQISRVTTPPSKAIMRALLRTTGAHLPPLLERLRGASPPAHITDTSIYLGMVSAQVLGLVLAFGGLIDWEYVEA